MALIYGHESCCIEITAEYDSLEAAAAFYDSAERYKLRSVSTFRMILLFPMKLGQLNISSESKMFSPMYSQLTHQVLATALSSLSP